MLSLGNIISSDLNRKSNAHAYFQFYPSLILILILRLLRRLLLFSFVFLFSFSSQLSHYFHTLFFLFVSPLFFFPFTIFILLILVLLLSFILHLLNLSPFIIFILLILRLICFCSSKHIHTYVSCSSLPPVYQNCRGNAKEIMKLPV
jgi:hypothetical protein